jgi:hypothetical protein
MGVYPFPAEPGGSALTYSWLVYLSATLSQRHPNIYFDTKIVPTMVPGHSYGNLLAAVRAIALKKRRCRYDTPSDYLGFSSKSRRRERGSSRAWEIAPTT